MGDRRGSLWRIDAEAAGGGRRAAPRSSPPVKFEDRNGSRTETKKAARVCCRRRRRWMCGLWAAGGSRSSRAVCKLTWRVRSNTPSLLFVSLPPLFARVRRGLLYPFETEAGQQAAALSALHRHCAIDTDAVALAQLLQLALHHDVLLHRRRRWMCGLWAAGGSLRVWCLCYAVCCVQAYVEGKK